MRNLTLVTPLQADELIQLERMRNLNLITPLQADALICLLIFPLGYSTAISWQVYNNMQIPEHGISPSATRGILETTTFPRRWERGFEKICLNFEFRGPCCRLYICLDVRGASSKTIKTGLNWRVKMSYKEKDSMATMLSFGTFLKLCIV